MLNTKALIDGLVRQTTVLIAHVATSAGLRAPLAHVANQIFIDLTAELEQQGLGQKVIADMFGLALRSYQQKLQRLSESATDHGKTLWIAVYEYLSEKQSVRRADVLKRFCRDDEASVKAILKDLCESGLVYRTGKSEATVYRATPAEDLLGDASDEPSLAAMVWVVIHHEGPLSVAELQSRVSLASPLIEAAVQRLLDERQIVGVAGEPVRYRSDECVIPLGAREGWEAALLDHFQAVVRSMCVKLQNGKTRALPDDEVGGSTYTFDVWPGHPQEREVRALLRETRARLSELWDTVTQHNSQGAIPESAQRVTFYCGQSSTQEDLQSEA
jgi:hypothetical protein